MKALEEFRITGDTSYAPSPVSAGWCLIWMGLCLIAAHVSRSPKRIFYIVQRWLVWRFFRIHNYTNADARTAWMLAGFWFAVFVGMISLAGYLISQVR